MYPSCSIRTVRSVSHSSSTIPVSASPVPESDPFSASLALFAPKPVVLQRRWRPPPLITLR